MVSLTNDERYGGASMYKTWKKLISLKC